MKRKLNNKNFVDKAPTKVVEENRKKLVEAKKNLEFLKMYKIKFKDLILVSNKKRISSNFKTIFFLWYG